MKPMFDFEEDIGKRSIIYAKRSAKLLALSQCLQILGFIFRSHPPTFVKITPGRFYQLSHFLMYLIKNLKYEFRCLAHYKIALLTNFDQELQLL